PLQFNRVVLSEIEAEVDLRAVPLAANIDAVVSPVAGAAHVTPIIAQRYPDALPIDPPTPLPVQRSTTPGTGNVVTGAEHNDQEQQGDNTQLTHATSYKSRLTDPARSLFRVDATRTDLPGTA